MIGFQSKLHFMYYLKHEEECFIRYIKHEVTAECFTSDKARTASALNDLKDELYEFIGEVILKINVVKLKAKVYVNYHDFYHI
jgi:hypothetical protein